MRWFRNRVARESIGGWLVRLLLVASLVRALIPAGFMPDFSGADGLKLVICTASGNQLVDLDETGQPSETRSHASEPCAFSGIGVVALPVIDFVDFVPPAAVADLFVPASTFGLPPVRAGPTLGSRAPPFVS